MSLRALLDGPLPVTAPRVVNPLMAKLVEAAGFPDLAQDFGASSPTRDWNPLEHDMLQTIGIEPNPGGQR